MEKPKTAAQMAINDMVAYYNELGIEPIVAPSSINTTATRKLNRELGLHRINYIGNTNGNK